jgi:hypothetical protein
MKRTSSCAMAVAIALGFSGVASAQDQLFSIKGGETLMLRSLTSTTANCDPLFVSFDSIDVIEGPTELSLKFEPGKVNTYTSTRTCPEAVPGGRVMLTATGVDERKEANLVFRVSYQTRTGPWQQTIRFRVLMFPGVQASRMPAMPGMAESGSYN